MTPTITASFHLPARPRFVHHPPPLSSTATAGEEPVVVRRTRGGTFLFPMFVFPLPSASVLSCSATARSHPSTHTKKKRRSGGLCVWTPSLAHTLRHAPTAHSSLFHSSGHRERGRATADNTEKRNPMPSRENSRSEGARLLRARAGTTSSLLLAFSPLLYFPFRRVSGRETAATSSPCPSSLDARTTPLLLTWMNQSPPTPTPQFTLWKIDAVVVFRRHSPLTAFLVALRIATPSPLPSW